MSPAANVQAITLRNIGAAPRERHHDGRQSGSRSSLVTSTKVSFLHNVASVHGRRRRRVSDRRSGERRAALARLPAPGVQRPRPGGADQARAPPVDRRSRHEDLPERAGAAGRDLPDPAGAHRRRRTGRAGRGGGRHPSVLALERSDPVPRRALRQHRRRAAAARAVAAHLRPARARRRPGRDHRHRSDERGALLPAAPAGALDELAVLDGARHRAQVVPHDDLPALSAHRRARPLQLLERVRELRQAARRAALHRRREEDLVGRAAAPHLRHAGVPRVRRADASGSGRDARRAHPGDHREAAPAVHAGTWGSGSTGAR